MALPRSREKLPLIERGLFAAAAPRPAPALRAMTLASSSAGNATFVQAGATAVLVDAGISTRRIRTALTAHGISLDTLCWIVITHAHSDHCAGLATLLKQCPTARLVATKPVLRELSSRGLFDVRTQPCEELGVRRVHVLGDIDLVAVPTPHDAAGSVALQLSDGARRLALLTDMGMTTPEVEQLMAAAHACIIETNHCVARLHAGRYPASTKRRILSERGHLCNETAARLVATHGSPQLAHVICAHLSQENNHPQLARETMQRHLAAVPHLATCKVSVAARDKPSPLLEV